MTREGLDQPVGAAAINSTPRRMIAEQVEDPMAERLLSGEIPEGSSVTVDWVKEKVTFRCRRRR